jgi:serine/threonine protein phosphatase 1
MKKWIIGDVHGSFRTLLELVKKLPKDADIIFVGDLVDRGSGSREVINFIRKRGYDCIRGNHEEMMVNGLKYEIALDYQSWIANGGDVVMDNYDNNESQLMDDVNWLDELPYYKYYDNIRDIYDRPLLITHAPISNEIYKNKDYMKMIWSRSYTKKKNNFFNIFGHNITLYDRIHGLTDEKLILDFEKGYCGIDTGAFLEEGYLTAISFPNFEVIQQKHIS